MKEILILAGICFLQICMYTIGSKALFGLKMNYRWLPIIIGGSFALLVFCNVGNLKQYTLFSVLVYFWAMGVSFVMLEGKKVKN